MSPERQAEQRRALQICSAWLTLLSGQLKVDERNTRATIRDTAGGNIIAECSVAEALDLADRALERERA